MKNLEEKVIQDVFEKADAEFWLQLDDGVAERFWQEVREHIANCSPKELRFILKDYKRWLEDHS